MINIKKFEAKMKELRRSWAEEFIYEDFFYNKWRLTNNESPTFLQITKKYADKWLASVAETVSSPKIHANINKWQELFLAAKVGYEFSIGSGFPADSNGWLNAIEIAGAVIRAYEKEEQVIRAQIKEWLVQFDCAKFSNASSDIWQNLIEAGQQEKIKVQELHPVINPSKKFGSIWDDLLFKAVKEYSQVWGNEARGKSEFIGYVYGISSQEYRLFAKPKIENINLHTNALLDKAVKNAFMDDCELSAAELNILFDRPFRRPA